VKTARSCSRCDYLVFRGFSRIRHFAVVGQTSRDAAQIRRGNGGAVQDRTDAEVWHELCAQTQNITFTRMAGSSLLMLLSNSARRRRPDEL